MSNELKDLFPRIEEDIDGLRVTPDGLAAVFDVRYGTVPLLIEHDEESGSVRIGVTIPPPAGSGATFLLWLLALNTQYWDLKVGLNDDGSLLFHSDLDVEEDRTAFAATVLERCESLLDLLDEDLIHYLLTHGLGTPAQRARWEAEAEGEDLDDQ